MTMLETTRRHSAPVASLLREWLDGLVQRRRARQSRHVLRDMPDHIKRDIGLIDSVERTRRR